MKKKIIFSILLSVCLAIGAILLINKSIKKDIPPREYIVVTATGKTNYNFPIALDKGLTANEVAMYFTHSYSHLQRKQGIRFIDIKPEQRINSDIQIKIS